MNFIEVTFDIKPKLTGTEILIAQLSQIGYESFLETNSGLQAYIPERSFKLHDLQGLPVFQSDEFKISFSQKLIKEQNWNEFWESNYNPVLIKDLVFIRAPFHEGNKNAKYNIIIEPRMSFGTAHHETTSMMIELMLDENMTGKSVLDMGCGTGILAILAEMLGASGISAIDNDEWAYNNTLENVRKNKCRKVIVQLGDAGLVKEESFDFILANINRNILLNDMQIYVKHLSDNGVLLLSGFYKDDLKQIESSAIKYGLKPDRKIVNNKWIASRFVKI